MKEAVVDILKQAVERDGSDVFIVPGSRISVKVNGHIIPLREEKLTPADSEVMISDIYELGGVRSMDKLRESGDDDFSFSIRGTGRFRCNAYKQRNSLAAVLRVVSFELPDPLKLHIPDTVIDLYQEKNGMILITGPAGSGKSTTLACIIDRINERLNDHVITIEDPIEFLHTHKKSIVSQREISHDTASYAMALKAALRQAPDVILLGEMRDFETIQTALTAAETGQLLLSTLHTVGAAKTIDRIIDVFPANQQQQVRIQLSMVLRAVVSQQLIRTVDGGLEPVFEILIVNHAIQNMIRENKVYQIDNVIFSGGADGMRSMDTDIARLYREGKISREDALSYAANPALLAKRLDG